MLFASRQQASASGHSRPFRGKEGLGFLLLGIFPFLRCYPGFRIPQPLEISENWGSLSFYEVANDLCD